MSPLDFDPKKSTLNLDTTVFAYAKTGTGLDTLVEAILINPGLNQTIKKPEIIEGAKAAAGMNALIIEAVRATGAANDGEITGADVRDVAQWLKANRKAEWTRLHGDDEKGVETGFHYVQGDGDGLKLFGDAAVDQVADGLYHLGFGHNGHNLINEDGNANAEVTKAAFWLNELLKDDLARGTLKNGAVDKHHAPTSGTGLDTIVTAITEDPGLAQRLTRDEINEAAGNADTLNALMIEGIKATGIANDGHFTAADMRSLGDWIKANHLAEFRALHGRGEAGINGIEWQGGDVRLFGKSLAENVATGLYDLGFGVKFGAALNIDGKGSASLNEIAHWLNTLLADDLNAGSLKNAAVETEPRGTTGTALDGLIGDILNDPRLNEDMTTGELAILARNVNGLNGIVVEAIRETGVGADGEITALEIDVIGQWIGANRKAEWVALRGDDDRGDGIMGLKWEGGTVDVAGVNLFNNFGPALYSLGFKQKYGGIFDEDGDWSGTSKDLSAWLNHLLKDDLAAGDLAGRAPADVTPDSFAKDAVFTAPQVVNVREKDGTAEFDHSGALALKEGTITLTFTADDVDGRGAQVLFAKDHNGKNTGDMHLYFHDGKLWLRAAQGGENKYFEIKADFESETAYDLAISFGPQGLAAWVNGDLAMYTSDAKLDWTQNDNSLIIGATNAARTSANDDKLNSYFEGEIANFAIYDRALDYGEVAGLAKGVTVKAADGNQDIAGTTGADALMGGLGKDVIAAGAGSDVIMGGYGADRIEGGAGSDLIDAGHGQDVVDAGAGDDIILSRSDAREPCVAQLEVGKNGIPEDESGFAGGGAEGGPCPVTGGGHCSCGTTRPAEGNEDPQNELDPEAHKLYADQPIAADDVLTGGAGADIFRFQTLVNAKKAIILKHTREDGSINWAGVTGENDRYHDHWMDGIGDDTITDFNAAEGDTIEIAGHTTKIAAITYDDTNGDGVDDQSTIYLISDQGGNGGAHDQDRLGTITVQGALVKEADISVDSTPTYGIVETIADLDEAIAPLEVDDTKARAMNGAVERAAETTTTREGAPLLAVEFTKVELYEAPSDLPQTGTGLDQLVDWIITDPGLIDRTNAADIEAGARAGHAMNAILVEAIRATGVANDGQINGADVHAMSAWIQANRKAEWTRAHGDDEKNSETGFHKVQGNGAEANELGHNAVNTIADGIYHIGFAAKGTRLADEDGKTAARVEDVAYWLDALLADDFAKLSNNAVQTGIEATTGTGLDQLVDLISDDPGLARRLSQADIDTGAQAANAMNTIIIQSIKATGIANNGQIDASDVRVLADYIKANYGATWRRADGDDDGGRKSGFHLVQAEGADARLFGIAGLDRVADGIYHLGFGHKGNRLVSEDGKNSASLSDVAYWLEALLADDLADGTLSNSLTALYPTGSTGTGLDTIVELIVTDEGLKSALPTTKIAEAAQAADDINAILIEGIKATGIANDGSLDIHDLKELDDWIGANRIAELRKLNGQDGKGFDLADTWSAKSPLFGEHGLATVADALYSIGFGTKWGSTILDARGKGKAQLEDMAGWLSAILEDDLAAGRLYDVGSAYAAPASFADALVYEHTAPVTPDGTDGWKNIDHDPAFNLAQGTLAFTINADTIPTNGSVALVTKDARDYGAGGHTALYIDNGILHLRQQSTSKSYYLRADTSDFLRAGTSYNIALVFGSAGTQLFVDGEKVGSVPDQTINWTKNNSDIVLGGHGGWRNAKSPDYVYDVFDGTIANVALYDRALTEGEIGGLAGTDADVLPVGGVIAPVEAVETLPEVVIDPPVPVQTEPEIGPEIEPEIEPEPEPEIEAVPTKEPEPEVEPTAPDVSLTLGTGTRAGSAQSDVMLAISGQNEIDGAAGDDVIVGGMQNDDLKGGAGRDIIMGDVFGAFLAGNDTIEGGAGNDVMQGGRGADKFIFAPGAGSDVIGSFDPRDLEPGQMPTVDRQDFVAGTDQMVLRGFQMTNAQSIFDGEYLSQTESGVVFEAEGTSVLLYGLKIEDLSASDFSLA